MLVSTARILTKPLLNLERITTTQHGAIGGKTQTKPTKYYNLDAIISVGYRVNSTQATQFRIWATNLLREFMIKGFIMDDDRLKNGRYFGKAKVWYFKMYTTKNNRYPHGLNSQIHLGD